MRFNAPISPWNYSSSTKPSKPAGGSVCGDHSVFRRDHMWSALRSPRACAIDQAGFGEDRTIDMTAMTAMGRRSGKPPRIEIVFYRFGDDIYLVGIPAPKSE